MNRRMRVRKIMIMTMLPQRALQQPPLKRLLLPRPKSRKSQAVTRIQTRCTAWQAVKSGRLPPILMLQILQMLSVAATRTERTNCKLHGSQVVHYYMLILTDTVPMAISKSASYALAPALRTATASPPLSLRLQPPAVTVKRSTAILMQASSKVSSLITMNIADIFQALC